MRGFSSVRIAVKIGTFPSSSIKILSVEGTDEWRGIVKISVKHSRSCLTQSLQDVKCLLGMTWLLGSRIFHSSGSLHK